MCLSNFIGVLYIDVSCNNWRENVEVFFSFLFVLLYPYSVLNFMRAVLKLLKCTSILRFTLGIHSFLLLIWTCVTLNETDYWFWHLEEQVYPNYQCASVKALISVVEKLALWIATAWCPVCPWLYLGCQVMSFVHKRNGHRIVVMWCHKNAWILRNPLSFWNPYKIQC